MHVVYKIHKIFHLKRELKEVYANQIIENLAFFIIGIFIPAFLIGSGFGVTETVTFMLIQWSVYIPGAWLAARINARFGIKHTILLRSPLLIGYLAMTMSLKSMPYFFYPAAAIGGISMTLYWTSMNIEYVRSSDKKREGEEAGLMYGLPYLSAVAGPAIGATVLTLFGFTALFMLSAMLVGFSLVPLFLSNDYKADRYKARELNLFLDRKRAFYYVMLGVIYTVDFVVWGLHVFLSYGYLSLGISASLMGLGMVVLTVAIGIRSNTATGRRRIIRTGAFLSAILWILRIAADSEIEFMLLSLMGGFIITSFSVSLYADFSQFAKKQGPERSVIFRLFWLGVGHVVPVSLLLLLIPAWGTSMFIYSAFGVAAAASIGLASFRN